MRCKLHIWLLALLLPLVSCQRDGLELTLGVGPFGQETRKLLLLYEAGFNSLSSDFRSNIETLKEGWLPGKNRNDDVLLVFSHLTFQHRNYTVDTEPVLLRLYQEHEQVFADTLKVWPAGTPVAHAEMVTEVFNLVRELFPAAGYGAVLSSHSTGWLPEGYFSNPKKYEGTDRGSGGVIWASPQRRSFGQEYYDNGTKTEEIELHDLAAAIPYPLDYILFDACLMATVEVAWELRNVCSYLAVSPCEIPSSGVNYKTLAEHLLQPEVPDLKAVCEDYYDRYENSVYGATITMVDCGALDGLASVCRTLFDRYRSAIRNVPGSKVQVYDRTLGDKRYYAFFDLKDILRQAGASEEDLALLQRSLDEALVYEAHTPRFLVDVHLDRCCGLSMYLPAYPDYKRDIWHGTEFLDTFYKQHVSWNTATGLVE